MPLKKIIKFKELSNYIPLSRSSIWRRVKSGTFPKPIDLGGNSKNSSKGWLENDIIDWSEAKAVNSIPMLTKKFKYSKFKYSICLRFLSSSPWNGQ